MSLMQMKTGVFFFFFCLLRPLDSAKAQSEMHEQIKECMHTHHLQSSFKQKPQQKIHICSLIAPFHRMLSRIVYKSCKRQPLCDKTLSLCQNVWAFFTSSYTVTRMYRMPLETHIQSSER